MNSAYFSCGKSAESRTTARPRFGWMMIKIRCSLQKMNVYDLYCIYLGSIVCIGRKRNLFKTIGTHDVMFILPFPNAP
jgi:hypothetical protein